MLKWFGQQRKTKKEKTKQLSGRESRVVGDGRDEEQVVNFVNDLLKQLEAADTGSRAQTEAAEKIARVAETVSEKVGEDVALVADRKNEAAVAEPVAVAEKGERPDRGGADPQLLLEQGEATLYSGEVELVMGAPVNLKSMSKLYNTLQTIPELRILRAGGSPDRGISITLVLERPIPLMGMILSKVPGVEATKEPLGSSVLPGEPIPPPGKGKKEVTRIRLGLRGE